jgi:hypothetical protein
MTPDQREVLDFLTKGWKCRLRNQAWVLKESGRISSYVNIPGGEPTLRQLQKLGQIDAQNNITELGRVAVAGSEGTAPSPLPRAEAVNHFAARSSSAQSD